MAKNYLWDVKLLAYSKLVRGQSATSLSADMGISLCAIASWAKIAGMDLVRGEHGGVGDLRFDENPSNLEGQSYRRLSLADRMFIQACVSLTQPLSYRKIAAHLGVAASTVSREVARGLMRDGRQGMKYSAEVAHFHALKKRVRPRIAKLDLSELRIQVIKRLNSKHSPQQIAKRLMMDYPNDPSMHVSYETIYQALYVQGKGSLRHELKVHKSLRSGRKGRRPRSKLPPRSSRPWLQGARLSDRPAQVEDRAVPGHWEGDLVVGPHSSGLITLVERQNRYVLIGKLPGDRGSATVIEVMQDMAKALPLSLWKTLTWDQGQEMAQHVKFTVATGCQVYFCDPHSPWQRGSNENTNGLIRDYYPKGTDFNSISDAEINRVQNELNDRPRRTLDYHTPREKLAELFNSVALTT